MPLETASAASALKKATSAVRKSGIGRVPRVVSMSESFRFRGERGGGTPRERRPDGGQADRLDRLGEQREPFDRLRLRVQHREARRDRERVAPDQAREDERRGDEQNPVLGPKREGGAERGRKHRRRDEADAGARSFLEVLRCERAVDSGADRAREDDDVDAQGPHLTFTCPCMSWLWSVQT